MDGTCQHDFLFHGRRGQRREIGLNPREKWDKILHPDSRRSEIEDIGLCAVASGGWGTEIHQFDAMLSRVEGGYFSDRRVFVFALVPGQSAGTTPPAEIWSVGKSIWQQ